MVYKISLRQSSCIWDEGSEIAEAGRNSLLIWAIKWQRAGSQTENRQDIANYRVPLLATAIKWKFSAMHRCPMGIVTSNNHHGLFASWARDLVFIPYPSSDAASTTQKKSGYIHHVIHANILKTSFPLPCPETENNHDTGQIQLCKADLHEMSALLSCSCYKYFQQALADLPALYMNASHDLLLTEKPVQNSCRITDTHFHPLHVFTYSLFILVTTALSQMLLDFLHFSFILLFSFKSLIC